VGREKEIYRISNKIVPTTNITQSGVGDKRGLWATVIAAAILISNSWSCMGNTAAD
jgi:arginine decarboxylase